MIIPSSSFGIVASSRPRIAVAVGLSVNWANIGHSGTVSCGTPYAGNPPQQITGIVSPINLRVDAIVIGNTNPQPVSMYYRKSVSSFSQITPGCSATGIASSPDYAQYTALTTYSASPSNAGIIEVSNGDYLAFACSTQTGDGQFTDETFIIRIRNASSGNELLDEFTVTLNVPACFLTTAMVGYFGLADDGNELTAMRQLRSHYKDVPGYDEILAEYSQVSRQIICAIQTTSSESTEYNYIYNTVLAIKSHVDLGEWQEAHDLYMEMYVDLKNRYIG